MHSARAHGPRVRPLQHAFRRPPRLVLIRVIMFPRFQHGGLIGREVEYQCYVPTVDAVKGAESRSRHPRGRRDHDCSQKLVPPPATAGALN